jgi:hypothetical protein
MGYANLRFTEFSEVHELGFLGTSEGIERAGVQQPRLTTLLFGGR